MYGKGKRKREEKKRRVGNEKAKLYNKKTLKKSIK